MDEDHARCRRTAYAVEMIWLGASSLRFFVADNSQYYSDCEERRLTRRCSQRLIRLRCFDVQLDCCACQSCHLRSPEPWLSLSSLAAESIHAFNSRIFAQRLGAS